MSHHEHPTELLGPLLRGEIDAERARQIEDHVATCTDCAAEKRALEALHGPLPPLTDIDRARLHREVWAEVAGETTLPGPSWSQRLAPYLSAAAVMVLLAVGFVALNTSGGGDDESGDGGGAVMESGGDQAEEADTFDEGASSGGGAANDAAGSGAAEMAIGAVFDPDLGPLTQEDLAAIGVGAPFDSYRELYDAAFARDNALPFLKQLAASSDRGDLVRRCGRRVLQGQSAVALAGFGGNGTVDGIPALVIGFATSSDDERLDSFSVLAFDRSNCAVLLIEEGTI